MSSVEVVLLNWYRTKMEWKLVETGKLTGRQTDR